MTGLTFACAGGQVAENSAGGSHGAAWDDPQGLELDAQRPVRAAGMASFWRGTSAVLLSFFVV